MRARLAMLALLSATLWLPSSVVHAALPTAGVLYWSPKAGEVRVWVYGFGTTPVAGTFHFRGETSGVESFSITGINSARQTGGSRPSCAVAQTKDVVAPDKSFPTLVCPLRLPVGVKLDVDLAVTGDPRKGNASYDFGGKPEFGFSSSAASTPPPDFTVKATWLDRKAGKLKVVVKNVGTTTVRKIEIHASGAKITKLLSSRRIRSVGDQSECLEKKQTETYKGKKTTETYVYCPHDEPSDTSIAAVMAMAILGGVTPTLQTIAYSEGRTVFSEATPIPPR